MSDLMKALLKAQTAMPTSTPKDAVNPHFKARYTSLDKLLELVRPVLNQHGILLLQKVGYEQAEGQLVTVSTVLTHAESGEATVAVGACPMPADPQKQGAAITYLRRYGLMAILGLAADDDDDGNAWHAKTEAPKVKTTPPEEPTGQYEQTLSKKHVEKIVEHGKRKGYKPKDIGTLLKDIFGDGIKVTDLTVEQGRELVREMNDRAEVDSGENLLV